MNIFTSYYNNGRMKSIDDLKLIYRILAKEIHPDVNGIRNSEEQFIKLKNDFDEMSKIISKDTYLKNIKYTRNEFYELFQELIATGFLLSNDRPRKTKQYKNRVSKFNNMLKSIANVDSRDMLIIESALDIIKQEDTRTYETIKLIFYNISYYQYEPRPFIKKSTLTLYEKISKIRNIGKYEELYAILSWFVNDMENGSIY